MHPVRFSTTSLLIAVPLSIEPVSEKGKGKKGLRNTEMRSMIGVTFCSSTFSSSVSSLVTWYWVTSNSFDGSPVNRPWHVCVSSFASSDGGVSIFQLIQSVLQESDDAYSRDRQNSVRIKPVKELSFFQLILVSTLNDVIIFVDTQNFAP